MAKTKCGVCRNRAAAYMEKALEEFDKIILIDGKLDDRKLDDRQLMEAFQEEENFKGTDKKVLILWEQAGKRAGSIEWRKIAEEEINAIMELYYMYEFSNRIVAVGRGQAVGSLLDYVTVGLLTGKEMIKAVLQ